MSFENRKNRRWYWEALIAVAFLIVWVLPVSERLTVDRSRLKADGRSTVRIDADRLNLLGVRVGKSAIEPQLINAEELGVSVLRAADGTMVVRAGHATGTLAVRHEDQRIQLLFEHDARDRDRDGFPDATELLSEQDRAAFVAWFTTIAEAQATRLDDAWARIHQDCAGLVRFAVREALKTHDQNWLSQRRYLPAIDQPDVQAVRYPHLPFIGDLPFRRIAGAFDPEKPVSEQFTAAPGARALWQYNAVFISRDLLEARAGDLLFFSVPYGTGSRMHTMIVLGDRPGATNHERGTRLVYHTGSDAAGEGTVRLVTMEQLLAHPDADWHPRTHNPRFLGVHRLSIVEHNWASGPLAYRGDS